MGGLIGAFSSELGALAGKSDRWWLAAAAQVLCYVGLGSGDVIARKFPVHAADRYRELEGETIDGLFAVDRLSGSSAAFEAQGTRVSDETPVLLRFFPESLWSESVADRHREAKFFRHPNLLRCIATGEVESGDSERLFYAAFELPGVTLAELLEGRALTPPEARQLGREVVAGLRYLHCARYGALQPGQIFSRQARWCLAHLQLLTVASRRCRASERNASVIGVFSRRAARGVERYGGSGMGRLVTSPSVHCGVDGATSTVAEECEQPSP